MKKYLVEVPHSADEVACAHAVKNFLELGSHLLPYADWGCKDGVHKLWVTIEADSKPEAILILPPLFRINATVVGLNRYTMQDIDEFMENVAPVVFKR